MIDERTNDKRLQLIEPTAIGRNASLALKLCPPYFSVKLRYIYYIRRSDKDAADGLVTLSASQLTTLHDKPQPGIQRGKGKEATEKRVVPRSGSTRQRNSMQLETIGETASGPECLAVMLAAYAPGVTTKVLTK